MEKGTEIFLMYQCEGGIGNYVHDEFKKEYGRDFDEFNPTEQDNKDYEALFGNTIEEVLKDYYKLKALGTMDSTDIHKLSMQPEYEYDIWISYKWKQVVVSREID
jgi:hypothetical protein